MASNAQRQPNSALRFEEVHQFIANLRFSHPTTDARRRVLIAQLARQQLAIEPALTF